MELNTFQILLIVFVVLEKGTGNVLKVVCAFSFIVYYYQELARQLFPNTLSSSCVLLQVFLDYLFFIAPSVFANVYLGKGSCCSICFLFSVFFLDGLSVSLVFLWSIYCTVLRFIASSDFLLWCLPAFLFFSIHNVFLF